MRLVSLVLHNYRKFKHSTIMFPDGVIGLLGANGAGKSTILEAIGWAIFGNNAARTTKDLVKREGAGVDDECRVELEFEIGDNKYSVVRRFGGKTQQSEASVTVNGALMASSSLETTCYLEDSLGMDYTSFFTSLIARQKELNALSDKTPGERKKIVMRMLKIDAVDEAIRHVREDRRDMENRIRGIQMGLKDVTELQNALESLESQEENFLKTSSLLDKEFEALQKKVGELRTIRDEEQEKFEVYSSLDTKRERINEGLSQKKEYIQSKRSEAEDLRKKQAQLKEMEPRVRQYEDVVAQKKLLESQREKYHIKKNLGEEITSLADEIKKATIEIERVEKTLKKISGGEEKLNKIQIEKKSLEGKKETLEKLIHQKKAHIEVLENRIHDKTSDKKKIEELGPRSNCPTCKRPLGDHYQFLLSNFSQEINQDSTKLTQLQEALKQDASIIDNYTTSLVKLTEKENKLKSLMVEEVKAHQELKHLQKMQEEKEEKLDKVKTSFAQMGDISFDPQTYDQVCTREQGLRTVKDTYLVVQSEVKRLPSIQKDIHQLQEDLESLQENRGIILSEIEKLGFNKEKYQMVNKKYEERREDLNDKEKQRFSVIGDLKQCTLEKNRIKKDIDEQKNQGNLIKDMRRSIMKLEILAGERDTGLLNEFKRYLTARISPLLSQYGSQLFTIFTRGKYNTIDIDDNYEIFIYDKGERLPLNRFSGGESDLANLCLRLAISQVVAKRAGHVGFRFIALDEIFGSQDTERKMNVLNALHELSHQFRQILLITHIEEVKDSMEHILQVTEGEDGISHVEMV